MAGSGIAEVLDLRAAGYRPRVRTRDALTESLIPRTQCQTELRYPANSVVIVTGVPGAGKTTLLSRLFPEPDQVLDSEHTRARWMPVLGGVPYRWWRPLLHLAHYTHVLRTLRGSGPFVMHDPGTRPLVRRLIGWRARRSGLAVHLIMLDVPDEVARSGQVARGRTIRSRSMSNHTRRWSTLRTFVAEPSRIIPGAQSAVLLTRDEANSLQRLTFTP